MTTTNRCPSYLGTPPDSLECALPAGHDGRQEARPHGMGRIGSWSDADATRHGALPTAELPYPVAYVATDALPPHLALYGTGETRQGALEDARERRRNWSGGFRVLRATARLVEAAEASGGGPGGNIWGVFQDSHGDFADLAGPDGERRPVEDEKAPR